MNIKFFNVALGISLTATIFSASAQKIYKQGVISYSTEMRGQPADVKQYFSADSSATVVTVGPANVKILTDAKHDYLAVLIDVPVASIKKAGIATPAELEEGMAALPTFTYTPTTEAKQISGFNCKKVVAKDNKSGKTYDIWITNDISVPTTAIPFYYTAIGGFPVQYTAFQQGQETSITISKVTDDSAPAGTYGISKDYEKGSLADLNPGG
ncbi:hypothetical protein JN11_03202 [Mucilaginibacter frigoritolerans]|uniref:GLPGLI family protein n=1 Tax=Mucilaginibacter frigoritolerans TaxID=652788 RepID=A0A562TXD5_9SPHI|nr:hypothetical protein [Mucilaginibacter frigoritolerans]TWI98123.1 hypothetical protein JN11_03202 [Mucilaginibacter frigoritolerans]